MRLFRVLSVVSHHRSNLGSLQIWYQSTRLLDGFKMSQTMSSKVLFLNVKRATL